MTNKKAERQFGKFARQLATALSELVRNDTILWDFDGSEYELTMKLSCLSYDGVVSGCDFGVGLPKGSMPWIEKLRCFSISGGEVESLYAALKMQASRHAKTVRRKAPANLCLKFNNCARTGDCALCKERTDPKLGLEVFVDGTWDRVCEKCAEVYARPLYEARLLTEAPEDSLFFR